MDPDAVWGGQGMGVLDGVVIVEGEQAVLVVNMGHRIVMNGDYGVVVLCREGWRRGFSQITSGGLVIQILGRK